MAGRETHVAVETDFARRVVTLAGWRRWLYLSALSIGFAGAILQVLDLTVGGLDVWARVGDVAILLSLLIPFGLLGAPERVLGRASPIENSDERTRKESSQL